MSGDSQIEVPPSFLALYVAPGRSKPQVTWATLASRYELCEDMAQMLTGHAQEMAFRTGLPEADVLRRCLDGLQADDSPVSREESEWVVRRLAELVNWLPLDSDGPDTV